MLIFSVADFKHFLIHVHKCLESVVDESVNSSEMREREKKEGRRRESGRYGKEGEGIRDRNKGWREGGRERMGGREGGREGRRERR